MTYRHIRMNIYGNWYGYWGTRRVREFGLDSLAADRWLYYGDK